MIRSINGKTPHIAPSAFVSEAAYVVGDVEIGEGASVWPGAVIRGDLGKITIGRNAVIEDNCVVHSGAPHLPPIADVTIGEGAVLGHAAVANGRRIGNHVMVGMHATVLHDAEIGDYSIIAAGCVVKERMKVPDHSFVAGVPAEIKRRIEDDTLFWFEESPRINHDLAMQYKEQGL